MSKVLLVEDDNNLREIYEARLKAEGYTISTAQNGEEALSAAKQHQPDLIISDVMMPRISGFEMLDILRNTDGLKDTKIIMLTALGQAEDRTRADGLGADKYLVKSQVTLEDIVNAAKELLSGSTAAASAVEPATTPTPPEPTTAASADTTVPASAAPTAIDNTTPPAEPVADTPAEPTVDTPQPEPAAVPAEPATPTDPPAPVETPAAPIAAPAAEPTPSAVDPAVDVAVSPTPVTPIAAVTEAQATPVAESVPATPTDPPAPVETPAAPIAAPAAEPTEPQISPPAELLDDSGEEEPMESPQESPETSPSAEIPPTAQPIGADSVPDATAAEATVDATAASIADEEDAINAQIKAFEQTPAPAPADESAPPLDTTPSDDLPEPENGTESATSPGTTPNNELIEDALSQLIGQPSPDTSDTADPVLNVDAPDLVSNNQDADADTDSGTKPPADDLAENTAPTPDEDSSSEDTAPTHKKTPAAVAEALRIAEEAEANNAQAGTDANTIIPDTPAPDAQSENSEEHQPAAEHATVSGHKVITPLNNASDKPTLDDLLAKEEGKSGNSSKPFASSSETDDPNDVSI